MEHAASRGCEFPVSEHVRADTYFPLLANGDSHVDCDIGLGKLETTL